MSKKGFGSGSVVLVAVLCASSASRAPATVFINEVCINPPGSLDDFREYIELQGTPGRKLDGYAIAFLNGGIEKYFVTIPPLPEIKPEIDEFFSLDGLELGANGLLVIAITNSASYFEVLSDTSFFGPWSELWNGGLDPGNRLSNDGSNTVVLLRNRPGRTEAEPNDAGGLRWAKSLYQDFERFSNVIDPQDGIPKFQWGDGDMDHGQPNGISGNTVDVLGSSTPTVSDDLEIVDEVSYESDRGWEYDSDDRHVDAGSTVAGLPERRVHALDDPQGFNPDALTRVDYRVLGSGWIPAAGGAGELPGGRNWQDTASEQWIRGETDPNVEFSPDGPLIHYWNEPNGNVESVQPFMTNVPRWLHDGAGVEYTFALMKSYRLMAGRVNPLAIPFIPGDFDRDGDCDAADIAKIATVFGDDDWVFSNAFPESAEGNDGDPTQQVRPWDVDASGDHGIEASDLQWALNFQGNTNGRVVGARYDSTTPSATGVTLNAGSSVRCTITTAVERPCGQPAGSLQVGDEVELIVRGQVTTGARTTPGQENGIMQFVHDVNVNVGGVLRVVGFSPVGVFRATRSELASPLGFSGDRGMATVNGYATSFTQGTTAPVDLYRVRIQAIGAGTGQVSVRAATSSKFAASTPQGLKVGHTNQDGNPIAANYPAAVSFTVSNVAPQPANCDGQALVTLADHDCLVGCLSGPDAVVGLPISPFDMDGDRDVDLFDVSLFIQVFGE